MPISPEQKEELTQRILDVTERQIAEHGLAALSTRAIGREAGCSGGSIYTRFADLDALVLAVNSRVLARFGVELASVSLATKALGIEERFCRMAFAYLDFALAHRHAWGALFEHHMAEGRPLPDWHRDDHYRLFGMIEQPLRELDPGLTPEASAGLARTIYSAVHGIVSLSIEDRLGRVPVDMVRRQLRIVLNALVAGLRAAPPSGA